jgi:hypothetical protein
MHGRPTLHVLCRYYGVVQMLSMRPLMIFMSETSRGDYKALHKQIYNDNLGHLNNAGKGALVGPTPGNRATAWPGIRPDARCCVAGAGSRAAWGAWCSALRWGGMLADQRRRCPPLCWAGLLHLPAASSCSTCLPPPAAPTACRLQLLQLSAALRRQCAKGSRRHRVWQQCYMC